MPNSFTNIREIAIKTIPSASKIEIKRVLESLYGFQVEKVHTLNIEGKKKKRDWLLIAKPDYKKAYVTLKNPLSISPDLYPIRIIEEDKKRVHKQTKSSVVQEEARSHWLDDEGERASPCTPPLPLYTSTFCKYEIVKWYLLRSQFLYASFITPVISILFSSYLLISFLFLWCLWTIIL